MSVRWVSPPNRWQPKIAIQMNRLMLISQRSAISSSMNMILAISDNMCLLLRNFWSVNCPLHFVWWEIGLCRPEDCGRPWIYDEFLCSRQSYKGRVSRKWQDRIGNYWDVDAFESHSINDTLKSDSQHLLRNWFLHQITRNTSGIKYRRDLRKGH